jgi:NAD(P) transhydrogenase
MITANVDRHRIALYHGHASFLDERTVQVAGAPGSELRLAAPVILIATGSYPNWPEGVPRDPRLYDSDSVLRMDAIPRSLAVVGAGVIGCEYATTFRALGVDVTLVGSTERLLPFLDQELSARLRAQVELLGLRLRLTDGVGEVRLDGPRVTLRLRSGGVVEAERVLFATGRMGATQDLGLERIGLIPGARGHLEVDEHYRTAVPNVYAVGDVIGFPALAATSMEQARVAMCHAFDLRYKQRVHPMLPMAIYTIPEIAAAGETEQSCRERGIPYAVGRALYRGNSRGQIIGDLSGLLKLVFARDDQRLLGVHVIGELASELVHVGLACLHHRGGIDDFIQMVFNYPTLGEAYKYAAYDGLRRLAEGRD